MREYGSSLTLIFSYKGKIYILPYMILNQGKGVKYEAKTTIKLLK